MHAIGSKSSYVAFAIESINKVQKSVNITDLRLVLSGHRANHGDASLFQE